MCIYIYNMGNMGTIYIYIFIGTVNMLNTWYNPSEWDKVIIQNPIHFTCLDRATGSRHPFGKWIYGVVFGNLISLVEF